VSAVPPVVQTEPVTRPPDELWLHDRQGRWTREGRDMPGRMEMC